MKGYFMKKLSLLFVLSFSLLAQADPSETGEREQNRELTATELTQAELATELCDETKNVDTGLTGGRNSAQQNKKSHLGGHVLRAGKATGNALFVVTKEVAKAGAGFAFGIYVGIAASLVHKVVEEKFICVPYWPEYKADTYANKARDIAGEYLNKAPKIEPGWRLVENKKFAVPKNLTHEKVAGSAVVLSLLPALPFGVAGLSAIAGTAVGYSLFWSVAMEEQYKQ
jgi:hypothetical protein